MHALFTYGAGVPRYVGLWLVLTPVLVAGLLAFGVRRGAVLAVALSTLPSLTRNPPQWLGPGLQYGMMAVLLVYLAAWLVARVRAGRPADHDVAPGPVAVPWRKVVALAALALALRVPLAWWDPGISQIGTSTELADRQLLAGHNPYTRPNRFADAGTYQYPAGTLLLHAPAVALVPKKVAGEEHVGVRLVLWLTDVAVVAFLVWAGARAGAARAGLAAAFAYTVGPTLVRESGLTVSNDLVLALFVAGAAVALTRRRPMLTGVLVGLAVAVKPSAVLLLPLLVVVAGAGPTLAAAAVPAVLQAPFFLWPSVGLHHMERLLEPATRRETLSVLRISSMWWPLYKTVGNTGTAIRAAAAVGVVVSALASLWAGRELRRRGVTLSTATAAFALPLLVAYALAAVQRTNYQDWYLTSFLLCAGLTAVRVPKPVPVEVPVPEELVLPLPVPVFEPLPVPVTSTAPVRRAVWREGMAAPAPPAIWAPSRDPNPEGRA